MKPCPCGAIPTTSSDLNYSVVWCSACHKTLTKEYITPELAIIAWQHGEENIPAPCPFCPVTDYYPPDIDMPESNEPRVHCGLHNCPLGKKVFKLADWNRCRPRSVAFEELLKRWQSKKDRTLQRPILALKRALATHQYGGRYARSRFQ